MRLRGLREQIGLLASTALLLPLMSMASCGGGGGGGVPPIVDTDPVLAEATIGPAGGTLSIAAGEHAGLVLAIPAGAVAVATQFRVLLDVANGEVPSLFPVYRFEPQSLDLSATPVRVTVPAGNLLFASGPPALTMFARDAAGQPWRALTDSVLDSASRTLTATATTRLGEFVAWEGNLHRLFTQGLQLHDPARMVQTETLFGVDVPVAGGVTMRQVGQGSLTSFWNSPAQDNVIVLHGVFGSPLDFLGAEDLSNNLALTHSNVVLMSYPSARGIAYAANSLYDLILANRKSGFGCSIIGHSIGGLIGRYMLEQSPTDPDRPGYQPGDPNLDEIVPHLILIGVPNTGAKESTVPFDLIETAMPVAERQLLQVGRDLSEQPDSLPFVMNDRYIDNRTRYHVIYGDVGNGTDGVVSVDSAKAVPLSFPETAVMFNVAHDDLHRRATSTGIAVVINNMLQAR